MTTPTPREAAAWFNANPALWTANTDEGMAAMAALLDHARATDPAAGGDLAARIEALLANTARGYSEDGRCWWVRDHAGEDWRLPTLTDEQYARYLAAALAAAPASEAATEGAGMAETSPREAADRPRCSSCGQPSPCAHVRAVVAEADHARATDPAPDADLAALAAALEEVGVRLASGVSDSPADDVAYVLHQAGWRRGAPASGQSGGDLADVDDVDRVCVSVGLTRAASGRALWQSGTGMRGVQVRPGDNDLGWLVSVRDGRGGLLVADLGAETSSTALLREAITEAHRIAGGDRG